MPLWCPPHAQPHAPCPRCYTATLLSLLLSRYLLLHTHCVHEYTIALLWKTYCQIGIANRLLCRNTSRLRPARLPAVWQRRLHFSLAATASLHAGMDPTDAQASCSAVLLGPISHNAAARGGGAQHEESPAHGGVVSSASFHARNPPAAFARRQFAARGRARVWKLREAPPSREGRSRTRRRFYSIPVSNEDDAETAGGAATTPATSRERVHSPLLLPTSALQVMLQTRNRRQLAAVASRPESRLRRETVEEAGASFRGSPAVAGMLSGFPVMRKRSCRSAAARRRPQ